jgi:hypothetical protein
LVENNTFTYLTALGPISSSGSGYDSVGVEISRGASNTINNNYMGNLKGGAGAHINFGGAGGEGVGVRVSGSSNNVISGNFIENIEGGDAGYYSSSGSAYGIEFASPSATYPSTGNSIWGNTVRNLTVRLLLT